MNDFRSELQRQRLLEFLRSDKPAWLDENHPELAEGAYGWVRQMRKESDLMGEEKPASKR